MSINKPIPGFREVPQTGVIFVIHRANEKGYRAEDPAWVNLGQGAPETGAISNAPERISYLEVKPETLEYSPVVGQKTLREQVAKLYNTLFRKEKESQYTYENVSISGGGRIALTRIAASLSNINMGHIIPDYTAYEELLSIFKAFIPIPLLNDPEEGYLMPLDALKKEILGRGLKALLLSNPCNPTGQVIKDEALESWVNLARETQCSFIFDEFYSHYIYNYNLNIPKIVSAAQYVENVNEDPILIVDGLTKNWRYPGWRISWTIGPKSVIKTIASAGSFLDGGANSPMQSEILPLLDPEYVVQDTKALQACFQDKRNYTLTRLKEMGILVETAPEGTFYCWANLTNLPAPLNDGFKFFEAALDEKVIVVPGVFFDVNPEKRRSFARFQSYVRISFGPEKDKLAQGLDGLERVIKKYN